MASNQEATIPLRYWVDNEQKRVVMAEASGDFVDVPNSSSVGIFYSNNYYGLILQDNYINYLLLVSFILYEQIK